MSNELDNSGQRRRIPRQPDSAGNTSQDSSDEEQPTSTGQSDIQPDDKLHIRKLEDRRAERPRDEYRQPRESNQYNRGPERNFNQRNDRDFNQRDDRDFNQRSDRDFNRPADRDLRRAGDRDLDRGGERDFNRAPERDVNRRQGDFRADKPRDPNFRSRDNSRREYRDRAPEDQRPRYDRPRYDSRPQYDDRDRVGPPAGGRYDRDRSFQRDTNFQRGPERRDTRERSRRTSPQRPTNITKALVRLLFASRGFSLTAIQQGRVTLNGVVVKNPNVSVRLLQDEVKVDGVFLIHNPRNVYVVMNKPKKFAGSREQDSRHVMNLISKKFGWFIPCGPLAKSASGIIVLTNDPEQADANQNVFALMEKEYWFKVNAVLTKRGLTKIEEHIEALHDENKGNVKVEVAQKNTKSSWLSVTVMRARIQDLTKIIAAAGHEILAIERRRIGTISVTDLPAGSWRRMSEMEMKSVITKSVSIESVVEKVDEIQEAASEETSVWQKLYQRWFRST